MSLKNSKIGFIKVTGGKIYYEIVGKNKGVPLVVLHGGPGYPHDYLKPLQDLSANREVIFYDQLGCGNSEWPTDKSLWTIDRFSLELKEIIKELKLKRYHLLGHSWGAALAIWFALAKPAGLISIILTSPYISTSRWEKDVSKLLQKLPTNMQQAIRNTKSKAYKKASKEFYDRYVKRLKPMPRVFSLAKKKKNNAIYNYMWGPEEFVVTGTLKDFNPTNLLAEIKFPILLLCGRYDEATPKSTKYFQSLFPNARFKVFEDSAHYPFWNKRNEYMKTVRQFLQSVEK